MFGDEDGVVRAWELESVSVLSDVRSAYPRRILTRGSFFLNAGKGVIGIQSSRENDPMDSPSSYRKANAHCLGRWNSQGLEPGLENAFVSAASQRGRR